MSRQLPYLPDAIDSALRERAGRERRSLNEIVIETLHRGLGITDEMVQYSDLDDLAGTWQEDPLFDLAVAIAIDTNRYRYPLRCVVPPTQGGGKPHPNEGSVDCRS